MPAFHSAFLITFSLVYLSLLALEIPFLIYYPLENTWSLPPVIEDYGPAMTWYGHVIASLTPALIAGLATKVWPMSAWLRATAPAIAALAMIACAVLMRDFFFLSAG